MNDIANRSLMAKALVVAATCVLAVTLCACSSRAAIDSGIITNKRYTHSTMLMPMYMPESYVITIENDGPTANITVNEQTYDSISIGDQYPATSDDTSTSKIVTDGSSS